MRKINFEKIGIIASSFSYIFQIPFALYLTYITKWNLKKIFEDKTTKILLLLLFFSGLISSLLSKKFLEAFLVSLIPFIFVWFYMLGKESIKDPQNMPLYILYGSAILGSFLLFSKLLNISLYLGTFPLLDGKANRGLVLGVGIQGLSLLLEFGIISGFGLLLQEDNLKKMLKILALIIISFIGFLITETRGGIIGLALGFIFILFSKSAIKSKNLKIILALLIIFLGVFIIGENRFKSRLLIALEKDKEGSIYERLYIYLGTFNLIKNNLFFGVGPGLFMYEYPKYALKEFPYIPEETKLNLSRAITTHNIYLYFLSGWGIIGTFLFFAWLIRKIYIGIKSNYSYTKHIIFAILMVYFGHVVLDDLFSIHVPLLIGVLNNKNLD